MLHALRPFDVDEKAVRVRIEPPKAEVQARYLSPVPLAFRRWDGYEPKPPRAFPNQWHVEAATTEKLKECGMLTAIVPHRASGRPGWTAQRIECATALGVRIEKDGKAIRVLFRKAGVSGEAAADGLAFTDPVAVR